ncbi:uncharacterized protein LOC105702198 isoform X2 [Orussus abietinus]|uniref:uncharacterized protein LOC105702198 isoform X2 n=1 Tax=Orussus abietinus TaxID=222816 RepID=UPI00062563F6|nr:uncharacterized protein LOC105702198 isoform X2 [Orussus abietinus]
MENQGYEEDSASPSLGFPASRSPGGSATSSVDAHVYEDIGSGSDGEAGCAPRPLPERVSPREPVDRASGAKTEERRGSEENPALARQSSARAPPPGPFHRTLTLPLQRSRDVGLADQSARASMRVTNQERLGRSAACGPAVPVPAGASDAPLAADRSRSAELQDGDPSAALRQSRRRKKKDCKHCKNKMNANYVEDARRARFTSVQEGCDSRLGDDVPLRNDAKGPSQAHPVQSMQPLFVLPNGRLPDFAAAAVRTPMPKCSVANNANSVFSVSNNVNSTHRASAKALNYNKNDIEARLANVEVCEDKALITPEKNRGGMKVNSIYSQEHWSLKEAPIFITDLKEQGPFQRAYSLPARTHTPSSENRLNLRRSVRGEPPPHPARLRKHRHGWTLHFARPLHEPGCTRSIVMLLLVVLALLTIGGIALYIVFEPDKLQIIQQYLRSSAGNATASVRNSSEVELVSEPLNDTSSFPGASLNASQAFPETTLPPETDAEGTRTEIKPEPNATRYCDDCVAGEVCVARVDEEVPTCRAGPDPADPTGCAGLCLINKQKCHRLDVDAFRCVEVEHYCLDDEWTCSNTLCIPLTRHCDGHMNCYDHSDEYNCACDFETHFQCGNETSCLPLDKRCDGKIDCWDASDEMNCTVACPLESEFTCSNGQCILKARFCDGLADCADKSDEPQGCQGRCNQHEFTCQNDRCIPKGMKCNGVDDCGDGSDEQRCRERFA